MLAALFFKSAVESIAIDTFFINFGVFETLQTYFMENYITTEKFTLIPTKWYKQEYLGEIFELKEAEVVKSYTLPSHNATLVCAFPEDNAKKDATPLVMYLIGYLDKITDHNKIIINYNKELNLLTAVAAEGNKLLMANSFRCTHINTLLYFLTLICQQVMFNTQITCINIYGKIETEEEKLISGYFQKISYINQ